jgi:hypothetical protein
MQHVGFGGSGRGSARGSGHLGAEGGGGGPWGVFGGLFGGWGLWGRGGGRGVAGGRKGGPLLGACSTWASAGLGVDLRVGLGIWAQRGGGSLVGLWWGLWWGLGGRGGRQGGDVVVEFLSAAPTSGRHPRSPATQTKRNSTWIPAASGPREPQS